MKLLSITILALLIISGVTDVGDAQPRQSEGVDVRLITDEADAVLAILAKRKANQLVTDADWTRMFTSEGYTRLKKRELSMGRSFEDADFREFVFSEELAKRAPMLEETVARWKHADVTRAGRLALAYLPKRTQIRAKIYPVIKPRENSFVFDIQTDPAIFLYVDPASSVEKFENTLAHELHHIGYSGRCPTKKTSEELAKSPPLVKAALTYVGSFGEGFAMLAAAGGPNIHPHAVSEKTDRDRWDRDVANFNQDLKKVEIFLLQILEGKLTKDEAQKKSFEFFGIQGPWYTVGWKMAVLIEKTYGRTTLIECMCDQRKLLATYNKAAAKQNAKTQQPLALWSSTLLNWLRRRG
jgi:hypothetical protein